MNSYCSLKEVLSIPPQIRLYFHQYPSPKPPHALIGFPPQNPFQTAPSIIRSHEETERSQEASSEEALMLQPLLTNNYWLPTQQQHHQIPHGDRSSQGGNSTNPCISNTPPDTEKQVGLTIADIIHQN